MSRKNLNDLLSNDRAVARAVRDVTSNYYGTESFSDKGSGKKGFHVSCHESHPPLVFHDKETGEELKIYGGSGNHPKVLDADIYIGFDRGMQITNRAFPWNPGSEVFFPIPDMRTPASVEEFKKLIMWTTGKLREGQKVHCGCIGGHGRTGLFFAALVRTVAGTEDAITYVREHYCSKVVESTEQVKWLRQHFGIAEVKGYKTGADWGGSAFPANAPKKISKPKGEKKARKPRGSEEVLPLGRKASVFAGSD